jgi:hypothetical protein
MPKSREVNALKCSKCYAWKTSWSENTIRSRHESLTRMVLRSIGGSCTSFVLFWMLAPLFVLVSVRTTSTVPSTAKGTSRKYLNNFLAAIFFLGFAHYWVNAPTESFDASMLCWFHFQCRFLSGPGCLLALVSWYWCADAGADICFFIRSDMYDIIFYFRLAVGRS